MKYLHLYKRILAGALSLAMCCAMLPSTAFAVEGNVAYNIVATSGTIENVTSMQEDDEQLSGMKGQAKDCCLGVTTSEDPSWFSPVFGKLLTPFKLTSSSSTVTFTMDKPTIDENDTMPSGMISNYGELYKIAVQDAEDVSQVYFFPTKIENEKVSVTIPTFNGTVLCALVQCDTSVSTNGYPSTQNNVEIPESIQENVQGTKVKYSWTYEISDDAVKSGGPLAYASYDTTLAEIYLDTGKLELDSASIQLNSTAFALGDVVENPEDSGKWTISLKKPEGYVSDDNGDYIKNYGLCDSITISFEAELPHSSFAANEQVGIVAGIKMKVQTNTGGCYVDTVTLSSDAFATMKSAVTITPADLTIYQGGDQGYEGVYGDGQTELGSNSLPHPLFKITAPSGTTIDPADLTFTTGEGENAKTWEVEDDGNGYYHFAEGAGQTPVRVTYTNSEGTAVTSDKFDVTTVKDTYAEFSIDRYPGENDFSKITASADNGATTYPISVNSGTLTVRAVAKDDPTSDVEKTAPTTKVDAGKATAVEPEGGTTYTLNNTGVELPKDSKPSLLFDDIIEDENSTERTDALKKKADEKLNGADANRRYEIKYLDLVDANNGNAWITSSAGTDIYWGYPEGTSQSTEFTLLHFKGLHRDDSNGGNSGFDVGDISSATVETVTGVENTPNGIKIHVDKAGFSLFALVWTESTGGGGGGGTTYYTIAATADDGGSIDPSGSVRVASGRDKTFTITADEGYEIADVLVDGESVGAVSEYTFENVRKKHTIEARFEATGEIPVKDPDETGVSDWLNTDDHIAYMSGYPEGDFRPDVDMTRAEAAQMFYNLLLDKDTAAEATFSDVPANAWYAEAVNALASIGVIEGIGDNQYAPDRAITRAEFTAIAMRFADLETGGENIFSDVAENAWYYDYVVGSIQYGWINGYPDGTFRPENTISRVEVTTIVNRMLGRSADENFVDSHADELRQFTDVNDSHWGYYNIMEAANAHDFTMENNTENWTALR